MFVVIVPCGHADILIVHKDVLKLIGAIAWLLLRRFTICLQIDLLGPDIYCFNIFEIKYPTACARKKTTNPHYCFVSDVQEKKTAHPQMYGKCPEKEHYGVSLKNFACGLQFILALI